MDEHPRRESPPLHYPRHVAFRAKISQAGTQKAMGEVLLGEDLSPLIARYLGFEDAANFDAAWRF
jgi:hypothetical protein